MPLHTIPQTWNGSPRETNSQNLPCNVELDPQNVCVTNLDPSPSLQSLCCLTKQPKENVLSFACFSPPRLEQMFFRLAAGSGRSPELDLALGISKHQNVNGASQLVTKRQKHKRRLGLRISKPSTVLHPGRGAHCIELPWLWLQLL